MQKIRLSVHLIEITNEWVGRIFCHLLLIIMVIMTMEVMLRYVFNRPTIWAWDVNTQLGAASALLAGGYTLLYHRHVRVDVIYTRFSPKLKVIADLVTSVFFFIFCGVLMWYGGKLAWASVMVREYNQMTPLAFPVYPLKVLLVVAVFLLFLQGGAKFIRDLTIALTGKEI